MIQTNINTENTLNILKTDLNTLHVNVGLHLRSAKEDAATAGEKLIEAKEVLKHGEFKPWVEENCSFSYRQAAKYMQVARAKVASRGTFEKCTSIAEVLNMGREYEAFKPTAACSQGSTTLDPIAAKMNAAHAKMIEGQEKMYRNIALLGEDLIEVRQSYGDAGYKEFRRDHIPDISDEMEAVAIFAAKEPTRFYGLCQAFPWHSSKELGALILKMDM